MTNPKIAALNDSMQDLNKRPARLLAMFFGPQGGGKTVLAAQLAQQITPPDQTIIYVDTADGWVSLQNHEGLRDRTISLQFDGISQLDTLGDAIQAAPKLPDDPDFDNYRNVGTIILDEGSTMANADLDVVTTARADAKILFDADKPEWDDRNIATNRFRKTILRLIKNTGCNIIILAHEQERKNKKQVTVTTPKFPEAISGYVQQPLHLVGYLTADFQKGAGDDPVYTRNIQCWPTNVVDAKSRVGTLKINEQPASLIVKIHQWLTQGGVADTEAPLVQVAVSSNDGPIEV